MLNLICNLVSSLRPASSTFTTTTSAVNTVLPIVPTPTILEVIIYCGFKTDKLRVNSSHDVSSTPFSQSGRGLVRVNVERELNRFYRAHKEGKSDKLRYRIAFVGLEGIENAQLFAAECEEIARNLAIQHSLVVRTALTFNRK